MERPIDADGTCRVSKPAAFVVPVAPEIAVVAHHPTISVTTDRRRSILGIRVIFASLVIRSHRVEL
jgi:hypothetical protein